MSIISKAKQTVPVIKSSLNTFTSAALSGIIAFQAGVYQTKHQVAVPYVETKQQLLTTTAQLEKKQAELDIVKDTVEVKASLQQVKRYYIRIKQSDGKIEMRTGGNSSWRYNNPGKLAYGNFAKLNGAIGNDGPLAVFPTTDDGFKALEVYLFESDFGFKDKTIKAAVEKFVGTTDGYNTKTYVANVLKASGLSATTKMTDLDIDEKYKLMEAIQKQDTWTAGNIMKFDDESDFKERGY